MSKRRFERFKKVLEEQLDAIAESIAPLAQCFSISADDQSDSIDHASANSQQFLALRLHERMGKFEEKLECVTKCIDQGTFGVCRECKEAIDPERLEARPMTVFCVRCKDRLEREENRRRTKQGVRFGRLHSLARFA